jgi:hypothetical protein
MPETAWAALDSKPRFTTGLAIQVGMVVHEQQGSSAHFGKGPYFARDEFLQTETLVSFLYSLAAVRILATQNGIERTVPTFSLHVLLTENLNKLEVV